MGLFDFYKKNVIEHRDSKEDQSKSIKEDDMLILFELQDLGGTATEYATIHKKTGQPYSAVYELFCVGGVHGAKITNYSTISYEKLRELALKCYQKAEFEYQKEKCKPYLNINNENWRTLLPKERLKCEGENDSKTNSSKNKSTEFKFLNSIGYQSLEDLDLRSNWENSNIDKSAAVPIGINEDGSLCYFDIKMNQDGSHGFVIGRSGSCKKELVKSWIISMSINYSPDDVAFVYVDAIRGIEWIYDLMNLPHTAGYIIMPHIDVKVLKREFEQLKNEIFYRIKEFEKYSVSSIDQYRKINPADKMPYLYIIIDDFGACMADMNFYFGANTVRDYMRFFVSQRKLGIHVVCVTEDTFIPENIQIMTDYVWATTVSSKKFSMQMIGTEDAALLSELNAAIIHTSKRTEKIKILYTDKEITNEKYANRTIGYYTECDAIVDYIAEFSKNNDYKTARKVITAPLDENIFLSELLITNKFNESSELSVPIGIADDVDNREKQPVIWDFIKNNHCLIYGAPSSGKTELLKSIVTSLTKLYRSRKLDMYIIDFDSWTLKSIRGCDSMIYCACDNEPEKINDIIQIIYKKLEDRMNNQDNKPYVVLAIDNLPAAIQANAELSELVLKIARQGRAYGIYLVATAIALDRIGYKIASNICNPITLYQKDKSEYSYILGSRVNIEIPEINGRGLIKVDDKVLEFQAAISDFSKNMISLDDINLAFLCIFPECISFDFKKAGDSHYEVSNDYIKKLYDSLNETFKKNSFVQNVKKLIKESGESGLVGFLEKHVIKYKQFHYHD